MKRQCAWCERDMGTVPSPGQGDHIITHGICPDCARKMFAEVGDDMTEFLDTLGVPVLVVDAHGTVRTANRYAREALGKSMPQIEGYRGGDVFSCAYAGLPGGCGNTGHCEACTIRTTVMDTYTTGGSHSKSPAFLDRGMPGEPHKVKFLISTEKREDCVVLRIDEVGGET